MVHFLFLKSGMIPSQRVVVLGIMSETPFGNVHCLVKRLLAWRLFTAKAPRAHEHFRIIVMVGQHGLRGPRRTPPPLQRWLTRLILFSVGMYGIVLFNLRPRQHKLSPLSAPSLLINERY